MGGMRTTRVGGPSSVPVCGEVNLTDENIFSGRLSLFSTGEVVYVGGVVKGGCSIFSLGHVILLSLFRFARSYAAMAH